MKLNFEKYKRIFCYGCSFTEYRWTTWADIIKQTYPNIEVNIWGRRAVGNFWIFNNAVEQDAWCDYDENDLVMIQWSSVYREDRWKDGEWKIAGNILTQINKYKSEFAEELFDLEGMLKRDLSYMYALDKMLSAKTNHVMFSMMDIDRTHQYNNTSYESTLFHMYRNLLDTFYPSFYKTLWDNDIDSVTNDRTDRHPLPIEHLQYLNKVFDFEVSEDYKNSLLQDSERILTNIRQ